MAALQQRSRWGEIMSYLHHRRAVSAFDWGWHLPDESGKPASGLACKPFWPAAISDAYPPPPPRDSGGCHLPHTLLSSRAYRRMKSVPRWPHSEYDKRGHGCNFDLRRSRGSPHLGGAAASLCNISPLGTLTDRTLALRKQSTEPHKVAEGRWRLRRARRMAKTESSG